MALDVQKALAFHIGQLLALDRLEPRLSCLEGGDVVEARGNVDRHHLIPMPSVSFEVFLGGHAECLTDPAKPGGHAVQVSDVV